MLHILHYEPGFGEIRRETNARGRCTQPPAASSWPTVTALRAACDALREGLAASRQYEQLRSRGVPHDTAIRSALGFGPSQGTRQTAEPLFFAGRA
jgi:hypothetical protein